MGGEVFKVCAGSGSCEAAVQTEDWLSWVVGGYEEMCGGLQAQP